MYNPPHPGEVLKEMWIDPMGISITELSAALNVSRKTVSEIVNGKSAVTPEMAVRLEIALGGSAESWLGMQTSHDLWHIKQRSDELGVKPALRK